MLLRHLALLYTWFVETEADKPQPKPDHSQFNRGLRKQIKNRVLVLIGMPLLSLVVAYWIYASGTSYFRNTNVRTLVAVGMAIALTLITLKSLLRDRYRRRMLKRITSGLCPKCGYDLRQSPTRCPECGDTGLDLSDNFGVAPGRDANVFRNAIILLSSYCLSLFLIANPEIAVGMRVSANRLYEEAIFALQGPEFDSDSWKNAKVIDGDRTVRMKMVNDLIENQVWMEMSPEQLRELLGPPDLSPENHAGRHAYFLRNDEPYFSGFLFRIKKQYVVFEMKEGMARSAYIQNDPIPSK